MAKLTQLLSSRGKAYFDGGASSGEIPSKDRTVESVPYLNLRIIRRGPREMVSLLKSLMQSRDADALNERLVDSAPEVAPRQFRDLKQFSLAEALAKEKAEASTEHNFFHKHR